MVFRELALDFVIVLDLSDTGLTAERLDSVRGFLYFLTSFSSFSRYTFLLAVIWAIEGDRLPPLCGVTFVALADLAGDVLPLGNSAAGFSSD